MIRPFFNPRSNGAEFWNKYTETMSRDELDELHLKRIKTMMSYAYRNSPMYKKIYDRAGIKPEDVRSLDDFVKYVPFIDKKDLIEAQAANPPYGEALAVPPEHIFFRYQTSGTTGQPLLIPVTYYSALHYGEQWNYGFWAVGMRPSDTYYFPFNWGSFIGFWSAYWAVRRMGGTVISGGGLDTEGRIRQMLQLKPTVMFATPTYALHMSEVAKKIGADLPSSSIRITYLAGEPGASIVPTRRAIEEAFGSKAYELYGIGEVGAIAPGCPGQIGVHLAEDQAHSLVVNQRGEPVAEGEVGENVVTSYIQFAQPVIKYRTHDLVRPYKGKCQCGKTWILFKGGVLGRTDNMIIIKGTNVYPTAIESLLGEIEGTSENYEIHVVHEDGIDAVTVKVEAKQGLPDARYDEVAKRAQTLLRQKIGVRIGVEVVSRGSLPRYELKAKRLFDHRPKELRWQITTG